MLERILSKTFTELATLVLVASVFTIPLFLAHSWLFRDVHSVSELAPEIREFPAERQVRGVSIGDLGRERGTLAITCLLAVCLLPLMTRAARRVHAVVARGEVPTVRDALTGPVARTSSGPTPVLALAVSGSVGVLIAYFVVLIGLGLTQLASSEAAWMGIGVSRGLGAACFLAVVGGAIAAARPGTDDPDRTSSL